MNRSVNDDVRSARSQATAANWSRAERCEGCGEIKGRGHLYTCPTIRKPDAPERYTDPACRFAKRDPEHVCRRRDGSALSYKADCHAEARAHLAELAQQSAARTAASAPNAPRYTRVGVPSRVREGHADCPSSAMTYGGRGAECSRAAGGCGLVWPLGRNADGELVGYVSQPTDSGSRPDEFRGWFN